MRSMCWKVLRKDAEMDAPTMMISLKISRENPWFGGEDAQFFPSVFIAFLCLPKNFRKL